MIDADETHTNITPMVRDRGLCDAAAPIVHDHDGRPMRRFGMSYRHDDRFWAFSVWAYGWKDAEERLVAIGAGLRIDGVIVAEGDL